MTVPRIHGAVLCFGILMLERAYLKILFEEIRRSFYKKINLLWICILSPLRYYLASSKKCCESSNPNEKLDIVG